MQRLSCWHRWEIYTLVENNISYAIKKAKSPEKKWAIIKEIAILRKLRWKLDFVPQIVDFWDDFFKYRFIEWKTFDKIKNPSLDLYAQLIEGAYRLDVLWIEHGELSKPTKNIIISPEGKLHIIDFERWSFINKNSKNLRWLANFFKNIKLLSLEECKGLQNIQNTEHIRNILLDSLSGR